MSQTRLRSKLDSVRFSDLLLKNPDIACYVRNLYYIVHNPIPDHELNVLDMLKERSSLQSIELSTVTVTYLYIYSFKEFPAKVLSGCSNLIDLKLGKLELAPTEVNQVIKPRSRSLLRSGFLTRYWPG